MVAVAELALEDAADAIMQHRPLDDVLWIALGTQLELPAPAGDHLMPARGAIVNLADRAQGDAVEEIELEHARMGRQRLLVATEPFFENLRSLLQCRDDVAWIR